MKELLAQFGRFAVVGIGCFLVDYALLAFLTEIVGLYYIVSATISYVLATSLNWYLSMRFVFKRRESIPRPLEYFAFLGLAVVGLAINDGVLWLLTDVAGIYYLIAKLGSSALSALWNFWSRRHFLHDKNA